ncbi:MAG: quinate 5-dehydrogenase [Armatimonadetes bacterium]|nr:quinate 5-dehydrogenase [Armatimonadota bacterium]MDW8122295.1 quinate 5-dehydrogenase [Armatimonadota bacterium]
MGDQQEDRLRSQNQGEQGVLRIVSVSLGSSDRDHRAEVELLGRKVIVERIGTDGDYGKACQWIRALDGKVDAIGLGGTDLYLVAGTRRYVLEHSRRLVESAKVTPVVDGSGLKNTLERETIKWLDQTGALPLKGKKVLLVSAVDRFGMAEAFAETGCQTIYGDLIFALGLPVPIRSLAVVNFLAFFLLPIIRRMPISLLYPVGEKQHQIEPKHQRYYQWADIIAGDFHFIRRYLPNRLSGKSIITNTVTANDLELLRQRGLHLLVTTTPEINGRSFGTNVMEGVLLALSGKRPETITPDDYKELLRQIGWKPRVVQFS